MKSTYWVIYNTVSDELQVVHESWLGISLLESGYLVLIGAL